MATARALFLAIVLPPVLLAASMYLLGARSLAPAYFVVTVTTVVGVWGIAVANLSRRVTILALVGFLVLAASVMPLMLMLLACSLPACH